MNIYGSEMFKAYFLEQMIWKFDTNIKGQSQPELLMTENETNTERLYNAQHYTKYFKDGMHRYVVKGWFCL